jgi:hypothetical protein
MGLVVSTDLEELMVEAAEMGVSFSVSQATQHASSKVVGMLQ